MSGLATILVYLVFIVVFSVISSKNKKKKGQQNGPVQAAPGVKQTVPQKKRPDRMAPQVEPIRVQERKAIQPTVRSSHEHDIVGTLGDVHDEGFDPCHEDELRAAVDPGAEPLTETVIAEPALQFSWTGNELVKSVVLSEILTRKH